LLWRCDPTHVMASSFLMFLDHTQRRTTVGRTPLDEWSAHRRDLYLTTHNIHNRQTFMPPVGFEPTISAGERPQTYALDCAAAGTGFKRLLIEEKEDVTFFRIIRNYAASVIIGTKFTIQLNCKIITRMARWNMIIVYIVKTQFNP